MLDYILLQSDNYATPLFFSLTVISGQHTPPRATHTKMLLYMALKSQVLSEHETDLYVNNSD